MFCSGGYFRCFFLFIDVVVEDRESDKEGYTDQILNAFNVGVVINQGVQGRDHACGNHVLPGEFRN